MRIGIIDCWNFRFDADIVKQSTTGTNWFASFFTHFYSVFFYTYVSTFNTTDTTAKTERTELFKRDFHDTRHRQSTVIIIIVIVVTNQKLIRRNR